MTNKIFLFCPALTAGGLERVISILSIPFAEHYNRVEILTWYEKPVFYVIDNRVNIISIEKESASNNIIKKMLWLRSYIKRCRPDILLSFSAPFNTLALWSLLDINIRKVVAERVDPRFINHNWFSKLACWIIYHTASGIIVQTNTIRHLFRGQLQNKIVVIPNPIFIPSEMIGHALLTEKKKEIVSVGRLSNQKRFDVLISAFSLFHKSHPEYKLAIYGDGIERSRLESLISKQKLQDFVNLPGTKKDVWERMSRAEMFVMTSEYEGMSNALLEAMSLGVPCISTKVSGAVDVIKDRENGILVDVDNVEEIARAMAVISDNKNLAMHIGRNATKIESDLSIDVISKLWIDYIDTFLIQMEVH